MCYRLDSTLVNSLSCWHCLWGVYTAWQFGNEGDLLTSHPHQCVELFSAVGYSTACGGPT